MHHLMNNPQVICIEQSRTADGQQHRKNDRSHPPQQDGQRTEADRSQGQSRTGARPGEGVSTWTPGGMNRARDSSRCVTVAKIASAPRYSFPSGQFLHQRTDPTTAAGEQRDHSLALWELLHVHLLSADHETTPPVFFFPGMRVRSAALLRAGPQSHFFVEQEEMRLHGGSDD